MDDAAPGAAPAGGPGNPAAAPPPPPPPPVASRRLTRSTRHRIIAGVCGGLGDYFQVEPLFFRIGFAALTFAGDFGLLLYAIGWVFIPSEGAPQRAGIESWARENFGRTRALVGGALIVVAVLVAADSLGIGHEGVVWGLALLAFGVFLLVQDRWQPAGTPVTRMHTPAPATYAAASFPSGTATSPWALQATTQEPRERSVLGMVTVAAALLAIGLATLIASATGVALSLGTGFGIALVTIGAGLVAGAWFGRSRMLIGLGILVLPFAAAAALVTEPLTGGTGDVHATPLVLADVQSQYHLAAGHLTVDLTQVDLSTASRTVTATVAFGQLTVIVPPSVTVDMRGHAGAGEVDLLGHVDDGVNIDGRSVAAASSTGTVHLDLSVGFGQVNVIHPDTSPIPKGETP
jgi:phage shock protein PspC (stress-responsive transcriptional regulator)